MRKRNGAESQLFLLSVIGNGGGFANLARTFCDYAAYHFTVLPDAL